MIFVACPGESNLDPNDPANADIMSLVKVSINVFVFQCNFKVCSLIQCILIPEESS